MIYVTSDTHFSHANIILYTNRPFQDVHEMNVAMTNNWNNVVGPNDEVWFLGDFSFSRDPQPIFDNLNGVKHLIKGNHDPSKVRKLPWASVQADKVIEHERYTITMSHYPVNQPKYVGPTQLFFHGHSHGKSPRKRFVLDVGVDCWSYAPISIDTAITEALNYESE